MLTTTYTTHSINLLIRSLSFFPFLLTLYIVTAISDHHYLASFVLLPLPTLHVAELNALRQTQENRHPSRRERIKSPTKISDLFYS
ncbi:hypothetical protein F4824DRAFT_236344 [Ustulina deusta]|nr:hypothetical protein F4824DRAFT_236344 [Ustulina deusta]